MQSKVSSNIFAMLASRPRRPVRRAFIYVARQVEKGIFPSLSFCQAFSLGNAKEKAAGGPQVRGGALVAVAQQCSAGRSWITKFTGCPHLFADLARPRVDTRMECCLHANEHSHDERWFHECS